MEKKQFTVYVDEHFLGLLREYAWFEEYSTMNKALAALALDYLEGWKAATDSSSKKSPLSN